MEKILESKWMDMTQGTYQAIQKIFEPEKFKGYPDSALIDKEKIKSITNHDFKILCELFDKPRMNLGFGLDEIVDLNIDLNSLHKLKNWGLLLNPENKTFKISPIGRSFFGYVEKELKDYINRDLENYKRN